MFHLTLKDSLVCTLSKLSKYKRCILNGDFNIDLNKYGQVASITDFIDELISLSFLLTFRQELPSFQLLQMATPIQTRWPDVWAHQQDVRILTAILRFVRGASTQNVCAARH